MLTFIPTATSDPFLDSVPPKTSRTLEQPRATLGNVFNRKILLCIPSKENPCECHSSKWPFHPITSNHLFHFYFWMYFFSCNAGILCCIWGILSLSRTIIDHFFFPILKGMKSFENCMDLFIIHIIPSHSCVCGLYHLSSLHWPCPGSATEKWSFWSFLFFKSLFHPPAFKTICIFHS